MIENVELGLTGKGVEPPRIDTLDRCIKKYLAERDERMAMSERESDAKSKLIDTMHEHEEELRQPDGSLKYRSGETTVSLVFGNEKLKVEMIA